MSKIQEKNISAIIIQLGKLHLRMFKMINVNNGKRHTITLILSVNNNKQEECGKSINKSHGSLHGMLPWNGNEERHLKMADSPPPVKIGKSFFSLLWNS